MKRFLVSSTYAHTHTHNTRSLSLCQVSVNLRLCPIIYFCLCPLGKGSRLRGVMLLFFSRTLKHFFLLYLNKIFSLLSCTHMCVFVLRSLSRHCIDWPNAIDVRTRLSAVFFTHFLVRLSLFSLTLSFSFFLLLVMVMVMVAVYYYSCNEPK